jgi:hypothetical protein
MSEQAKKHIWIWRSNSLIKFIRHSADTAKTTHEPAGSVASTKRRVGNILPEAD